MLFNRVDMAVLCTTAWPRRRHESGRPSWPGGNRRLQSWQGQPLTMLLPVLTTSCPPHPNPIRDPLGWGPMMSIATACALSRSPHRKATRTETRRGAGCREPPPPCPMSASQPTALPTTPLWADSTRITMLDRYSPPVAGRRQWPRQCGLHTTVALDRRSTGPTRLTTAHSPVHMLWLPPSACCLLPLHVGKCCM